MSKFTKAITTTKKPAHQDWHKADIICTLWKLGTSVQRLSREHDYHPNALNLVLSRPWPKAERIIAKTLGVTPQEIWPSRYHADGSPKSGRGERGLGRYKAKHSTPGGAVNVHAQRAA
jgi:Ner family transcriptional regulator